MICKASRWSVLLAVSRYSDLEMYFSGPGASRSRTFETSTKAGGAWRRELGITAPNPCMCFLWDKGKVRPNLGQVRHYCRGMTAYPGQNYHDHEWSWVIMHDHAWLAWSCMIRIMITFMIMIIIADLHDNVLLWLLWLAISFTTCSGDIWMTIYHMVIIVYWKLGSRCKTHVYSATILNVCQHASSNWGR